LSVVKPPALLVAPEAGGVWAALVEVDSPVVLVAPEEPLFASGAGDDCLLQPVRRAAEAKEIKIKDAFFIRYLKQYFANSDGDLQIDF
jgi:hypothetical protein